VIITLFVPLLATATNNPFPYTTEVQLEILSYNEDIADHVIPSSLVITLFEFGLSITLETATNKPIPYVTEFQLLVDDAVLIVHVVPAIYN
jgi:hypothetical protein